MAKWYDIDTDVRVNGNLTSTGSISSNSISSTAITENGVLLSSKYLGIGSNAVSATKLQTARTITLTGDASGSGTFDGSSNLSMAVTVTNLVHNHDSEYEPKNTNIQSHISSTSNPHGVTKSQVGLGSVSDYGLATQLEAQSGTSNLKYMTPLRVGEAIASLQAVKSVAGKTGIVLLVPSDVGAEPSFAKNTAFNKNFGTALGTVSEGNHNHDTIYLGIGSNAVSATKLATVRTISLSGDITGSGTFDGTANLNIVATIADDSHNHTILNIDGLQTALNAKLDATANAVSATKLATARAITLSGDVTGTASFDGSGDIILTATVADDSHAHTIANVGGLQAALNAKLDLTGGTLTGALTTGANNIVGSSATVYLNLGSSPVLSTPSNITIHADSDNSSTTEYLSLKAGIDDLRVVSNGTVTFNGNLVYHAGNLSPLTTSTNQTTGSGFTVGGTAYIGGTTGSGDLVVKSNNISTIHLDGDSSGKIDSTNVKAYIAGNGNADFKGTVTIQTLAVNTSTLVNNLNSKYLNGLEEVSLSKNESLADIGGYGVQSGLGATAQAVPNMTVKIGAGVVYTNTGRRVVLPDTDITVTTASTAYGRNDIIYLQGSSAGANEGKLAIAIGTPTASPVDPTTPSDSVVIARVRVPQNIGSITDGTSGTTDLIDDLRDWKPVFMSGESLYAQEILPGTYGANGTSAVFNKPIKNNTMAKSITIAKGSTSSTWTHNLPFGTNYAVQLSCNSSEPHVSWSSKTATAITVNLDDVCDDDVIVDIIIVGY